MTQRKQIQFFRLSFLVMMFLCLGILDANPAHACSGGAPMTLAGLIAHSDYVVKAHPTEIDDVSQNGILQVESYLAGGVGPEYLMFTQIDPVLVQYVLEGRSGGGDCIGFERRLQPNTTLYLFLRREIVGSYEIVSTLFNPFQYTFATPDSTVEVFLEGGEENSEVTGAEYAERDSGQQVTESEFLELVEQEGGGTPNEPNSTSPYPLKAPLIVTTASDVQYLVPVDGAPAVLITDETRNEIHSGFSNIPNIMQYNGFSDAGRCDTPNCMQISPDGLGISVQTDANTITLLWGTTVTGQYSLFSSTSDTIAVWNQCTLTVYSLGYPRHGQEWFDIAEANAVMLSPESGAGCTAEWAEHGAWSPDGRLLAYSDREGLWLWDVFDTENTPRLLRATTENAVPTARYFSPMGRYIAIAQGAEYGNLDLISDEILPDGVIAPDDRTLLAFDTTAEFFSVEACSLSPYTGCYPLTGTGTGEYDESGEFVRYVGLPFVKQVRWRNPYQFYVMSCTEDEAFCGISLFFMEIHGWYNAQVSAGYAFDYDVENDVLAIVQNENTLWINEHSIDLSTQLDGEITDVEWLPSLFYRL